MMPLTLSRASTFFFVVNPRAGRGSVGKQWPHILEGAQQRLGPVHFSVTGRPGDAALAARQALRNGAEVIVCVGGDGTLNEVITGMMEEKRSLRPDALLGLIPNGTGCDFVRTVHIPRSPGEALDVIVASRFQPLDLGRLAYKDHRGRPAVRYFHNVTSFGLGGEVDERVNRTTKLLGGFGSFFWATLLTVLRYRGKRIILSIDGSPEESITVMNVVIGNGQYHGGGMWVAPQASVNDGLFHLTIIGDFSLPEVLKNLPKLYNGRLFSLEKVRGMTAKKIEARSHERVLLDVDGEQPGSLPMTAEIVPSALRLIVP